MEQEIEDVFYPFELAEDEETLEVEIERPVDRIEKRIIELVTREFKEHKE